NRRRPPCEHFRRCGFLEQLMIPMRDPNRAQCPETAPAVDAATPPSLPATGDRRIQAINTPPRRPPKPLISQPPMAATSIPIAAHCSVDSNRYRHSALTTGRAQSPSDAPLDLRLRSIKLLCNPAFLYCPVRLCLTRDRAEPSIIPIDVGHRFRLKPRDRGFAGWPPARLTHAPYR